MALSLVQQLQGPVRMPHPMQSSRFDCCCCNIGVKAEGFEHRMSTA